MIAAAAFRNVVKEGSEVQPLGFNHLLYQAAREGELLAMLRDREAPEVAQDEQAVGVDGVDVKQVMLHLPDDAPECRNISAEHPVCVHAPQLVGYALRLPQDFHKDRKS